MAGTMNLPAARPQGVLACGKVSGSCKFKRIPTGLMRAVTDSSKDRNIYTHLNLLARDIYWKRLEALFDQLCRYAHPTDNALDFGGGSGAFIPTLSGFFNKLTVVDLDVADAISISSELGIENVDILKQDVLRYIPEPKFNAVILADVLEHFQCLDKPISWLRANVKEGGKILVSLPTENWVYEVGRRILGKQKPADHFHPSKTILRILQKSGFSVLERRFAPKYIIPIPLFEIAVFEKIGQ